MRDQHRNKRDLVNELHDVRQQVADLRQAAVERRRVEDGLRHEGELLRALLDQAPQPLCLLDRDASPLLANRAFFELLGYHSSGALVRLGSESGLFLGSAPPMHDRPGASAGNITFRRSDGAGLTAPVLSAVVPGTGYLAMTVLADRQLA